MNLREAALKDCDRSDIEREGVERNVSQIEKMNLEDLQFLTYFAIQFWMDRGIENIFYLTLMYPKTEFGYEVSKRTIYALYPVGLREEILQELEINYICRPIDTE